MRVLANMDSLATHVRPIAEDIAKLADAGMYKVRPLRWLTGKLAAAHSSGPPASKKRKEDRIWPIRTLPAWTSPVGAVDKKDKPLEKRRISNGSWPYGRPRTREMPHGSPTGPPCDSFNDLSGPMRPDEGAAPSPDAPQTTEWGSPCDFCGEKVADSTRGCHAWWGRLGGVGPRVWGHGAAGQRPGGRCWRRVRGRAVARVAVAADAAHEGGRLHVVAEDEHRIVERDEGEATVHGQDVMHAVSSMQPSTSCGQGSQLPYVSLVVLPEATRRLANPK